MKKILFVIAALFVLSATSVHAAPDIRDLLGGLAGGSSQGSGDNGSGLGNAIGGLISGLVGEKQLTEADLAGVYRYNEPAISFQSDNFLQQAGGAAASVVIKQKLEPYYEKAGMQNLQVTLNADKTCEFSLGRVRLTGTFQRDSAVTDANVFIFNFKAMKSIPVARADAYIQRVGSNLVMTFDASKLITLVNAIAKISGRATIQSAAKILNSYDGLNCGFSLTRTGDAPGQGASQSGSGSGSSAGSASSGAGAWEKTDSAASGGLGSLLDALRRKQNQQ